MKKMKKSIESATAATDLFICFTSRPSASKTLMSPNRTHPNPNPSLSSSLSRRLRTSGSIKGGQSPMFPSSSSSSSSRKKGAAFEPAEPSSPKVTCIGQVRVKSKKKKLKNSASSSVSRSRSGRSVAEVSFRRSEESRRKTVSVCDALSCLVPCGWSDCNWNKRERRGKPSSSSSSFVKWLMAVEEDEEGVVAKGRREFVGVIVRENDHHLNHHYTDNKEVDIEVQEEEEVPVVVEQEVEVEEGRVSVCVPPKNALLLMRCRSDPVRMAALANRFWDSPVIKVHCEEPEEEEEEDADNIEVEKVVEEKDQQVVGEVDIVVEEEKVEEEKNVAPEEEEVQKEIVGEVISSEKSKEEEEIIIVDEVKEEEGEGGEVIDVRGVGNVGTEVGIVLRRSISCSVPKSSELVKVKEGGGRRRSFSYREKESRRNSFSIEREARRHSFCSEKEARRPSFSVDKEGRKRLNLEKERSGRKEKAKVQKEEELLRRKQEHAKATEPMIVEETIQVSEMREESNKGVETDQVSKKKIEEPNLVVTTPVSTMIAEANVVEGEKKKSRELPDCLLLMMYEPKLSMEVSKETWVCSTDFLHWRPNYSHRTSQLPKEDANDVEAVKTEEKCHENKNAIAVTTATVDSTVVAEHPPPKPPVIEQQQQKLLSSVVGQMQQSPYKRLVLTRCKSEPGKSSARLAPDAWFWKSRHQPIGTAGVGF